VKSEQFRDCLMSLKRNHKVILSYLVSLSLSLSIYLSELNTLQDEDAKVKRAFQTLLRIVGNIAKNPNEDKYRTIRLSNPAFQVVGKSLFSSSSFSQYILLRSLI
jgi:UBX domain-containing protein 1/4